MELPAVLDEGVRIHELPDRALSLGVHVFTTEEAAKAAGIRPESAWPALARLVSKRQVFSPAKGLYIPIPPEYRSWGAVPARRFVDALMEHLERQYYVGLLSAAEFHGAAHQRPQVFQVVINRALRDRDFGRVRLRFITNRKAGDLPTRRVNVPTGTMAVSTAELTVVDLCNRPDLGGGLSNVATIVRQFARDHRIDVEAFRTLIDRYRLAALRRAGWMMEEFGELDASPLLADLAGDSSEPSNLDPHGPRRGHVVGRWNLRVNAPVEPEA